MTWFIIRKTEEFRLFGIAITVNIAYACYLLLYSFAWLICSSVLWLYLCLCVCYWLFRLRLLCLFLRLDCPLLNDLHVLVPILSAPPSTYPMLMPRCNIKVTRIMFTWLITTWLINLVYFMLKSYIPQPQFFSLLVWFCHHYNTFFIFALTWI